MSDEQQEKNHAIRERWGGHHALADQFTPISLFFLQHAHKLEVPAKKGKTKRLSSSEVMFIIHMMSFKWDRREPYPSLKTIAARMNLQTRQVRNIVASLEKGGYIQRVPQRDTGRPNLYNMDGLFAALLKIKSSLPAAELTSAHAPPPDNLETEEIANESAPSPLLLTNDEEEHS